MRHFLITAATTAAFAALLASAPANAVENYGPSRVGNQCFTPSTTQQKDLAFGSWGACPQPASTPAAPARKRTSR
jgi:uncharacterized membrane protein